MLSLCTFTCFFLCMISRSALRIVMLHDLELVKCSHLRLLHKIIRMILWVKAAGMRDSEALAVDCGASGAAPQSLTVADALIAAYGVLKPSSKYTVLDYHMLLRGVPLASTQSLAAICEQVTKATESLAMPLTNPTGPVRGGMSPLDPLAKPSIVRRTFLVFEFALKPEAFVPPGLHKQLCSPPRQVRKNCSGSSGTSLSAVISLMLGGRKLAMDAATPIDAQSSPFSNAVRGGRLSPRDSSPTHREPGATSSPQPPLVVELRSCVFKERWGTEICATCNTHRRFHTSFQPPVVERQKKLVAQSAASPHRRGVISSNLTQSPPWSWRGAGAAASVTDLSVVSRDTNGELQTPSVSKAPSVCRAFKAAWNGRDLCDACHQPAAAHRLHMDPLEEHDVGRRRTSTPGRAQTHARQAPAVSPTAAPENSSSRRVQRTTCSSFQPHWNNNSVCEHCYHGIELHSDPSSQRWRCAVTKGESSPRTGKRATKGFGKRMTKLIFSALPWHHILPYCSVEDLFSCACVSRLITVCARPLLTATMHLVLSFEATHLRDELRSRSMDIGEQLTHPTEAAAAYRQVVQIWVGPKTIQADQTLSFAAAVDALHRLAATDATTLSQDAAAAVAHLPQSEQQPELACLCAFLKALVDEQRVKRKAQAYLGRHQIMLG